METMIILCYIISIHGFVFTNADICLKSNLSSNSLILNCKVDNLAYKVTFVNPLGQELGFCLVPIPTPFCISYNKKGTILQNLSTNETLFVIKGEHYDNGNWSCRHGHSEQAFVEVRMKHIIGLIPQISVSISGPHSVRANEPVWFTCFASAVPVGKAAQILVNGSLHASLTHQNGKCYLSKQNISCSTTDFQCSEDGKMFSLKFQISTLGKLTVTCEMEFDLVGYQRDCIFSRIYDINGPFILASKPIPLTVSSVVELVCSVFGEIENIAMKWECSEFELPSSEYRNTTVLMSTLSVEVQVDYHYSSCQCIAAANKFSTSAQFVFLVNYEPVLDLQKVVTCNSSSYTTIVCTARGNISHIKFETWTHSFNGKVIRYIKGRTSQNFSILHIQRCRYEDSGEYLCRAFREVNGTQYKTNISSSLVVQGPPLIIESHMVEKPNTEMGVKYYAFPEPEIPEWFLFQDKLDNSSNYRLSVVNQTLLIFIHGTPVVCNGFASNLRIKQNSFRNTKSVFSVVIKNEFGNTTHNYVFLWEGSNNLFNLTGVVQITLVCVTVLITSIAFILLCKGRLFERCKTNEHTGQVYFTVNPESRPNVYESIVTDYEEIGNVQAEAMVFQQNVER